jgi:tryptophan synthase alpha chain
MSRIAKLFAVRNKCVLNIYCTAGFPELESTLTVMKALQDNGADMIELGIPYSDPIADGPVIQQSNATALANGMTIKKLFSQLKDMRKQIQVPVVLMGYMNPVLQYGFEKFCADASEVGVDGLILPDLPEYEFETEYGAILKQYALDFSFLVSPATTKERVLKLDSLTSGFLYAISSSSTTGQNKDFNDVTAYLQTLQSFHLKNPVLVGFGIRSKADFQNASRFSNGGIIGSAYIQALAKGEDIEQTTAGFIRNILA